MIYFVHGTAVAVTGEHVFKGVLAGFGPDSGDLRRLAEVKDLLADENGLYYLQDEGCGADYGESYLVSSSGITAGGRSGEDGSIVMIHSPIRAFDNYREGINSIKRLLDLHVDEGLSRSLLRLLYIGVCGEMEGYLMSTLIALIQGVREVFLSLRDYKGFPQDSCNEQAWRDNIIRYINERFFFQYIRNDQSKERQIYEMLLGQKLTVSQDLIEDMKWRNKLTHHVPYAENPSNPTKDDVLSFINAADSLVNTIDSVISKYKDCWVPGLS